ncbi:MAG TPA: hypothetical protein VGD59_11810 [Acidisarcina sp.]
MAKGEIQIRGRTAWISSAGGSCVRVKTTWVATASAGKAEWIAKQIWQCSAARVSAWECATWIVAASESNKMQAIAVQRLQASGGVDCRAPTWDLIRS